MADLSSKTPAARLPRPARGRVVGFGVPMNQLRRNTHHFWRMLQAARASIETSPASNDSDGWIEPSYFWEAYALAVQVFAVMTVEAALNTYGLVRFGEEEFRRRFQFKGPVERLMLMMELGPGVNLTDEDDLVRTLRSLIGKRNPIVHTQADEEVFDGEGKVIRPAPRPVDEVAGAAAAAQEMEVFLRGFAELVGKHDIESWTYVAPF